MTDPHVHCKRLDLVPDPVAYVDYYRRLDSRGLGPSVVDVTNDHILLQKHETLRDWVDERLVDGRLPDELRHAIRNQLVDLLGNVHELGFCHRDAHIRNFVVRGEVPLLVDPKYAIDSHGRSCYDLEGPDGSDVEIAPQHRSQTDNRNRFGVWWENADPISEALVSTFGTVRELQGGGPSIP